MDRRVQKLSNQYFPSHILRTTFRSISNDHYAKVKQTDVSIRARPATKLKQNSRYSTQDKHFELIIELITVELILLLELENSNTDCYIYYSHFKPVFEQKQPRFCALISVEFVPGVGIWRKLSHPLLFSITFEAQLSSIFTRSTCSFPSKSPRDTRDR